MSKETFDQMIARVTAKKTAAPKAATSGPPPPPKPPSWLPDDLSSLPTPGKAK